MQPAAQNAAPEVQLGQERLPLSSNAHDTDQRSLHHGGLDAEARRAVHLLDTRNVRHLSETIRFIRLTAAAFAMISASTSYAFNLFSRDLQSKYDYDSRQMSTINSVGMVFTYFLMPYGYLCDYVGPLPIFIIASSFFSIGALLMGLTFQGVITGSVVRFCVFNALLSLGSQLFDLASVTTTIMIFPTRKGWCIALLKTLMGLGSSIIASIQVGFFINQTSNYFYFLIALVVVVGIACMVFVRLPAYHLTGYEQSHLSEEEKAVRETDRVAYLTQEPPMWRFYFGIILILVLVVYLPTTSGVTAFGSVGLGGKRAFAIIAILLTLMLLLMMAPCPWLDRRTTASLHTDALSSEDREAEELLGLEGLPAAKHVSGLSSNSSTEQRERRPAPFGTLDDDDLHGDWSATLGKTVATSSERKAAPPTAPACTDVDFIAPQYQTTFLQSCCTLRFWCIFWTMFCGLGCEFVVIFNASFIYQALSGAPIDATVSALLTVLNGAGSALGRLAMSALEMYTQQQTPEKRLPLTAAFFVPTSFLIVSLTLFLILPGRALLLAYAVAALGNGFCASITILVLRTLYAKDPAKHYNFSINGLVPAAILLNRLLYGEWYAVQADKQGSKICYGRQCVLMPLLVMIGINCTAFVSTLYVHFSYMRFCRKVLAERRRLKEEAAASASAAAAATAEEDMTKQPHLMASV